MGYISSRRARLKAQLANVQAALTNFYNGLSEMSASGVKSYMFDSGEGSQRTTRYSYQEIIDAIRELEATETHLLNEIYGMGLICTRLRRKTPSSVIRRF
jgi:hypothetical protein